MHLMRMFRQRQGVFPLQEGVRVQQGVFPLQEEVRVWMKQGVFPVLTAFPAQV